MGLFRRRSPKPAVAPATPTFAESLSALVSTAGRPSLFAHAQFVKQVDCPGCGAPKRLPSATAYLYCDHCGALVDYDVRAANADTNAALTNTVFHHLIAPVQAAAQRARLAGDADGYRELMRPVFAEWLRQCPQAASPRARHDEEFRDRMVEYLVESTVHKDLDPALTALEAQMNARIALLRRIPRPGEPWLVGDGIWDVAALFSRLMEETYRLLEERGVLALDPDRAPQGVPLRMEYSTFCQSWLPHLTPDDGGRLLAMFSLAGEYAPVDLTGAVSRRCGGCGGELLTLPDARAVVCQGCGRTLDVAAGESPCQGCGAPLCLPLGVSRLACPSCGGMTQRV